MNINASYKEAALSFVPNTTGQKIKEYALAGDVFINEYIIIIIIKFRKLNFCAIKKQTLGTS